MVIGWKLSIAAFTQPAILWAHEAHLARPLPGSAAILVGPVHFCRSLDRLAHLCGYWSCCL